MKARFLLVCFFSTLVAARSLAESATWNFNPGTNDWDIATNWTPNTVPNGPADVASFDLSNKTDVSVASDIEIASVVFNPGASPFTIRPHSLSQEDVELTISGAGIMNNSAVSQNFLVARSASILLRNAAMAGDGTMFTLDGGMSFSGSSTAGTASFVLNGAIFPEDSPGGISFTENSTAACATFTLNGATVRFAYGGAIGFFGSSTAGNAVFVLNPASRLGAYGSTIVFDQTATAGSGVFTLNGGRAGTFSEITFSGSASAGNGLFTINGGEGPNAYGGGVFFRGYPGDRPSAGNATFVVAGGDGLAAHGGNASFGAESTAAQARLIANGGTNGGSGGFISFQSNSEGGSAQVELFGNGYLDVSPRTDPEMTVGSIAGDGFVYLGSRHLAVGSNQLSTTFAGRIQDEGGLVDESGGSLEKVGNGYLNLSNANSYTGGTTITAGTLLVSNGTGSATGPAAVQVSGGTIGGRGIIAGATTIGTAAGTGGVLEPGKGAKTPATFRVKNTLTFKGDGSYVWKLHTNRGQADRVIADGVTIEAGAEFSFKAIANRKLAVGTVFTAISNIAATPISGTFANLADGSTIIIGVNKLQVSYSGGSGNDLTLTTVP